METVNIKKRSKSTNACNFSPQVCGRSAISVASSDPAAKSVSKRTRCCRVIILQQSKSGSYGFTLQTYAFKNYKTGRAELLTYVDYVQAGGPASRAGMRRGDVIISINDKTIDGLQHNQLIQYIKQSPSPLRITVTYEDWCTRIDLNLRKLKLKQLLKEKYLELASLEKEEKELLRKAGLPTNKEATSNECPSELSSSTDQLSPFSSKRTSFMCTSLNMLNMDFPDDESLVPIEGGVSFDVQRNNHLQITREEEKLHHPDPRGFECHSLPIVRKKKYPLQNQVFSVCENVVRMGCFSGSSVNIDGSSLDLSSESIQGGDVVSNLDIRTWYGVPKMHRAALLKRQRKTNELSKWYFSIFDEDGKNLLSKEELETVDSTSSRSNFPLQSLIVPAEMPSETSLKVLSPSSLAIETLMNNLIKSAVNEEGDSNSSSVRPGFECLSVESQEFMNSFSHPRVVISNEGEKHSKDGCNASTLMLHVGSSRYDTPL